MKPRFLAGLGLLAVVGATALGAGISFAETAPGRPGSRPVTAERLTDRCQDRLALEAGRLAALETRLNLTDAQKPLWNSYKTASVAADTRARDACVAAVPARLEDGKRPTVVEREAAKIDRLEAELASLKSTQPALAALYPVLTEAQREIIDRPMRGRHDGMRPARFDRDQHRHGHRGGPGRDTPAPVPPAQ